MLGELYYGALKSGRPSSNLSRVDEFAASVGVREGEDKEMYRRPRGAGLRQFHLFTRHFQACNPELKKEMEKPQHRTAGVALRFHSVVLVRSSVDESSIRQAHGSFDNPQGGEKK